MFNFSDAYIFRWFLLEGILHFIFIYLQLLKTLLPSCAILYTNLCNKVSF